MVLIVLLGVVGLLAYSNTFQVPFQFDDFNNISNNPVVKNIGNFLFSTKGYEFNPRRYIGYLSFALNYYFDGLDVTGYHIVNLSIHIVNAILVYILITLILKTPYFTLFGSDPSPLLSDSAEAGKGRSLLEPKDSRTVLALFPALLFVAHPLQTEAVTYIVQRLTSLATLFYLLSVVLYLQGRLTHERSGRERGSLPALFSASILVPYLLSLATSICAMKTKEIAFTLPIVIMLTEFTFFGSSFKKRIILLIPVLLTLAVIPLSILGTERPLGDILSDLSEKMRAQSDVSRAAYLMTETRVIMTYIRLLFVPLNQNLDYNYPVYHSFFTAPVFLSFAFEVFILGLAVYLFYRSKVACCGSEGTEQRFTVRLYRLIAYGILWFFIALSVESSIVPIADVIFEHRTYLPSVGAFIAMTASLLAVSERLRRRRPWAGKAVIPLCAVIVLVLSGLTYARNMVWQDQIALWQDVLKKSPRNARAYNNLGVAYATLSRQDLAIEAFLNAISVNPKNSVFYTNLGIAYAEIRRYDLAVANYAKALALDPSDPKNYHGLGTSYNAMGRYDDALAAFNKFADLRPDDSDAYKNRAIVYANKRDITSSLSDFRKACSLGDAASCSQLR